MSFQTVVLLSFQFSVEMVALDSSEVKNPSETDNMSEMKKSKKKKNKKVKSENVQGRDSDLMWS